MTLAKSPPSRGLWCALMIRGAVKMPAVVRGHQRAAVHYKRPVCSSICTQHHLCPREARGRTDWGKSFWVSAKMECRGLLVFCTLFFCSLGVIYSSRARRHHTHLENSSAYRNHSASHRIRYPSYMMQLYRSFSAADSISSMAVNTFTAQRDQPAVHNSDSVLSLMAKG